MSMIEQQLNKIRKVAKCVYLVADKEVSDDIASTLNQAADTIEALSAKLAKANMERSERYYNGGWIPCGDELPEEKGWYLVYAKNQRPFVAYFKGKTFPLNNHYHEIVAWMPLPRPYKSETGGD